MSHEFWPKSFTYDFLKHGHSDRQGHNSFPECNIYFIIHGNISIEYESVQFEDYTYILRRKEGKEMR